MAKRPAQIIQERGRVPLPKRKTQPKAITSPEVIAPTVSEPVLAPVEKPKTENELIREYYIANYGSYVGELYYKIYIAEKRFNSPEVQNDPDSRLSEGMYLADLRRDLRKAGSDKAVYASLGSINPETNKLEPYKPPGIDTTITRIGGITQTLTSSPTGQKEEIKIPENLANSKTTIRVEYGNEGNYREFTSDKPSLAEKAAENFKKELIDKSYKEFYSNIQFRPSQAQSSVVLPIINERKQFLENIGKIDIVGAPTRAVFEIGGGIDEAIGTSGEFFAETTAKILGRPVRAILKKKEEQAIAEGRTVGDLGGFREFTYTAFSPEGIEQIGEVGRGTAQIGSYFIPAGTAYALTRGAIGITSSKSYDEVFTNTVVVGGIAAGLQVGASAVKAGGALLTNVNPSVGLKVARAGELGSKIVGPALEGVIIGSYALDVGPRIASGDIAGAKAITTAYSGVLGAATLGGAFGTTVGKEVARPFENLTFKYETLNYLQGKIPGQKARQIGLYLQQKISSKEFEQLYQASFRGLRNPPKRTPYDLDLSQVQALQGNTQAQKATAEVLTRLRGKSFVIGSLTPSTYGVQRAKPVGDIDTKLIGLKPTEAAKIAKDVFKSYGIRSTYTVKGKGTEAILKLGSGGSSNPVLFSFKDYASTATGSFPLTKDTFQTLIGSLQTTPSGVRVLDVSSSARFKLRSGLAPLRGETRNFEKAVADIQDVRNIVSATKGIQATAAKRGILGSLGIGGRITYPSIGGGYSAPRLPRVSTSPYTFAVPPSFKQQPYVPPKTPDYPITPYTPPRITTTRTRIDIPPYKPPRITTSRRIDIPPAIPRYTTPPYTPPPYVPPTRPYTPPPGRGGGPNPIYRPLTKKILSPKIDQQIIRPLQRFRPGYNITIQTKGKPTKRITTEPLTYEDALAFGARLVDKSIKRSFTIEKAGVLTREQKLVGPVSILRRSKRSPFIFVEKTKFAISTGGEKGSLKAARIAKSFRLPKVGRLRL